MKIHRNPIGHKSAGNTSISDYYDDIYLVNVNVGTPGKAYTSSSAYWQFTMSNFQVGNFSRAKTLQVIVDVSSNWIGAPQGVFNAVQAQLGASYNASEGIYTVPCNDASAPDFVFTIGGVKYNVPQSEYAIDVSSKVDKILRQGGSEQNALLYLKFYIFLKKFWVDGGGGNGLGTTSGHILVSLS